VSFATMMVHVDVDGSSDARIRLAVELAGRSASTLIGVSACVLPPYPAEGAYFVTPEYVDEERRTMAAALKRAEDGFRAVASAGAGIKVDWRSDIQVPDDYLAEQARAADLVVIGRDRPPGGICRAIDPGTAVLKLGRTVLVVPPDIDKLKAERVVIGWKDSREARRALRDSLPLLHEAKFVAIVEVCDKEMEAAGRRNVEDVAQYLARHRISIGSAVAAHTEDSVANELARVAKTEGADLIVTGAYGHSRLGEWVFGGVTRDLLTSSEICCLLAN
jgi:nucleotide-binding universal stress UspA family protein